MLNKFTLKLMEYLSNQDGEDTTNAVTSPKWRKQIYFHHPHVKRVSRNVTRTHFYHHILRIGIIILRAETRAINFLLRK